MHTFIVIAIVLGALVLWAGSGLLNITVTKLFFGSYYDDVLGAFAVIFGPGYTAVLLLSFLFCKVARVFERHTNPIVKALRDRRSQGKRSTNSKL
ncbi:MAG: hypothetical protein P4L53_23665 [Candidatus Obscuribacterales bacterium]|nr:hypothetical protein [Candidatus Obscuribacterales bacterium]